MAPYRVLFWGRVPNGEPLSDKSDESDKSDTRFLPVAY